MMNSRRLTFAVGTTLLTATLATTGCKPKHTVNVKPPEEPHVNEGPEETPHVNEGPETEEPAEGETEGEEAPGPDDGPIVNTRPD